MTNTYNMIQKNEYICIHLTSVPSPLDLNRKTQERSLMIALNYV